MPIFTMQIRKGMLKMKKFMLSSFKFIIVLLLVIGGNSTLPINSADAQESTSKEALLMMTDNLGNVSNLKEDLQELDPDAQFEEIKEINLLKIKASSPGSKRAIQDFIKNKLDISTDDIGDEQEIQLQSNNARTLLSSNTLTTEGSTSPFLRSAQWDVDHVTLQGESYNLQTGNHDVTIGLIDSGIDFNHPDLVKNIVNSGKSFVPGISNTQDVLGHGTMVAGSIAANGTQQGVGPDLGLIPYKVFHDGSAESAWIIEAIVQAANDGVDVINLSLGTYKSPKDKEDKIVIKAYKKAVKYAKKKGVFVVASAGSSGYDISKPFNQDEENQDVIHLPGGMKDVFTVAATTNENTLASYSNFGQNVDMGAPGGDYGINFKDDQVFNIGSMVLTTYPMGLPQSPFATYFGIPEGYDYSAGSSLASPKVAATAGLVIAEYEDINGEKPKPKEVEKFLVRGASNEFKSQKDQFQHGIINAYGSLELLQ